MAVSNAVLFPRRQNRDGSLDSICITCFATVASAPTSAELSAYDEKHVCDPEVLFDQANFGLHAKAETRRKSVEYKINSRF
jgi:hypothetical protein